MKKTLLWKKTIGALAIILGGLRFTTGLSTFSDIADLETTLDTYGSSLSTTFVLMLLPAKSSLRLSV